MTSRKHSQPPRPARLAAIGLLPLLSAALLGACGGGGSDASVAPAAALVYTQGTVEGVGDLMVNGVRFDGSQASVFDGNGAARSSDAVKLGMVVEVVAPAPTAGADGALASQAREIRFASEVQGPIASTAADAMVVLGQPVRFDARTVFEDGRAATLRAGQVVEVHGMRDAQGVLQASRIEVEDDRDEPYRITGTLSALDPAARAFAIGGARVSYASLATPVAGLGNGQRVRVNLAHQPLADGAWRATALKVLSPLAADAGAAAGIDTDIEGYVTRIDGPRRFVVAGVVVDASNARRFPAGLAVGSVVEVEGRLIDGVVVAREVELERRLDHDAGFEIEGTITAVDLGASTLQVRGLTVHFGGSRLVGGTAQHLVTGARIEVKGTLSPEGNSVNASVIEFD